MWRGATIFTWLGRRGICLGARDRAIKGLGASSAALFGLSIARGLTIIVVSSSKATPFGSRLRVSRPTAVPGRDSVSL